MFTFRLFDPMEQFEVVPVIWSTLSCPSTLTNLVLVLVSVLLSIHFFLYFVSFKQAKYTNWYIIFINLYSIAKTFIKRNTNLVRYEYFSLLFYLFLFIFVSNIFGLVPYSFTITSSFILTFFLASTHFIGITLIGIIHRRWNFAGMFFPEGVPVILAPLIFPIEIISYFSRVLSLSVRLFANMMSGHALLKILIGFSWTMLCTGPVYVLLAFFPWAIVTMVMYLELLIAFLQAYVFVMLTAIYINDSLSSH